MTAVASDTVMTPCGTWLTRKPISYTAEPAASTPASAPSRVPRVPRRWTTMNAIWLATMNSSVQKPSRRVWPSPTPRKSKRGRNANPARRRNGIRTSACTAMPAVEPEAEQQRLVGAEAVGAVRGAEDADVDAEHGHGDEVVGDRRPHHRAEAAAGVEHLPDQHERAVEEHLRHAQPHQQPGRLALLLEPGSEQLLVEHEVHESGDDQQQHDRGDGEHEQPERDDALGVGVAAVGVLLHGAHELRHEDDVEDAAGHQDVQRVGDGVGVVEQVGVEQRADREGDQQQPDEPGDAGDHGAERHPGTAPRDVGGLGWVQSSTSPSSGCGGVDSRGFA